MTCSTHRGVPAVEGKTKCQTCIDYMRDRYNNLKAKRVCISHPTVAAVVGKAQCQNCIENKKRNRQENKASGRCPAHPSLPAIDGKVHCAKCADGSRKRRGRRNGNGMCSVHAKTPVAPGRQAVCQKCVEYKADRWLRMKSSVFTHYGFKCACKKCPNRSPVRFEDSSHSLEQFRKFFCLSHCNGARALHMF